jgi:hypothetical protein
MSKHNRHHSSEGQSHESGDTQTLTAPEGNEAETPATGGNGSGVMAAFKSARDLAGNVREKAVAGAKVADKAINENPYKAVAIAVGFGVLLGMFLSRRGSRKV